MLGTSKAFVSSISEETKENFLKSLHYSLINKTDKIQFEDKTYHIVSQGFKSVRETGTSYLDEYDAINWIEYNKNFNMYVYLKKNDEEYTHWIRLVWGEKEFELLLK